MELREIKYRYTFKRKEDGHLWQAIWSMESIETGFEGFEAMLKNGEWERIARDQYIGMQDKKKNDIFENDIGEIKTQSGRIDRFIVKWGIHRRKMASTWHVDIPGFCFWLDNFPSFPIADNYQNGHDLDIIEIIGDIHMDNHLLQSL